MNQSNNQNNNQMQNNLVNNQNNLMNNSSNVNGNTSTQTAFDISKNLKLTDQPSISVGSSQTPGQNNIGNASNNNSYGQERYVYCMKCGQPMRESSRCCMHCGELNYLNDKNNSVKGIFSFAKKQKRKEDVRNAKKQAKLAATNEIGQSVNAKRYIIQKRISQLFMIVVLIIAAVNYKFIFNFVTTFRAKHYLNQVDKIVEQIDDQMTNGTCSSSVDGEDMIFSFYLSSDEYDTFVSLYTFDYFKGYVKVVPDGENKYKYYVTITDGKYGLRNVLYSKNLSVKKVKKFSKINDLPSTNVTCS